MKFSPSQFTFCLLVILLPVWLFAQRTREGENDGRHHSAHGKVIFVSRKNQEKIQLELVDNLLLIEARINDSAVHWFILDTGASNTVLDLRLARKLLPKASGKAVGLGAAGQAQALVFDNVTVSFANVRAVEQTVGAVSLEFVSDLLGKEIGGVIGNDIIKELVLEIDYAARKIELFAPRSYRHRGGEIVPLYFRNDLPYAMATILVEGQKKVTGKFKLDTGSTGAFLFNTPFVEKHELLKAVTKTKATSMNALGGAAIALLGRLDSLSLGRFHIKNSVARFSRAARGDYASGEFDGLIGGEILSRFKITLDYSREQMKLEPNKSFFEPFEIDMSGMEIIAGAGDRTLYLVSKVEAGSPAAAAGIRAGDRIAGLDKTPAKDFSLSEIRRMFRDHGREILLEINRDGQVFRAVLKLKRSL